MHFADLDKYSFGLDKLPFCEYSKKNNKMKKNLDFVGQEDKLSLAEI